MAGEMPLKTSEISVPDNTVSLAPLETAVNWLQRFQNDTLEEHYVEYKHGKPLKAFLFLACTLVLVYTLLAVADPGLGWDLVAIWWAAVGIVEFSVHLLFKRRPHLKTVLLSIERVTLALCGAVATLSDQYAAAQHFRSCSHYPSTAIDTREHYAVARCEKWLNGGSVAILAVVFFTGIIPSRATLGLAVYDIFLYLVLWAALPPPDPAVQIGMYTAFNGLGLAFVVFVHRDVERTAQKLFLHATHQEAQRALLLAREQAVARQAAALLPAAFLHRSMHLEPGVVGSTVDGADDAVVLLAGIHAFDVWCTTRQPIQVAGDVVELQVAVRREAQRCGLEFMGCLGDTSLCTAGLVRPSSRAAERACAVASAVLRREAKDATAAPIRVALHQGRLRGAFVGRYSLRYEVMGPALPVARDALLECPADRAVFSDSLLVAASSCFAPVDSLPFTLQTIHFTICEVAGDSVSDIHSHSNSVESEVPPNASTLITDSIVHLTPQAAALQYQQGSDSTEHRIDEHNDASLPETSEEVLKERLAGLQAVESVWCFFPRFKDPVAEAAFVDERVAQVPEGAARTWLAYAGVVSGVLLLLLVDLQRPYAIFAVMVLLVTIVLSVAMGVVPKLVSAVWMRRWFFPWSVTGILLPLLVVYGTALARPAAVGNDPEMFLITGAMMRSYCFASTRWMMLAVPLTLLISFGQYMMPGAYFRTTVFSDIVAIAATVVAEREREIHHREQARRRVEAKLVLAKLRAVDGIRDGLIRSSVPKEVLPMVKEHQAWNTLDGPAKRPPGSAAATSDGVVMVVQSAPSSRPLVDDHERCASVTDAAAVGFGTVLLELEAVVAQSPPLAISGIRGDQALVIGPVVAPRTGRDRLPKPETTLPIALSVGIQLIKLGTSRSSSAMSQPHDISIVVDFDAIIHAVEMGDLAQYSALGVTVTRVLTLVGSVDAASLGGLLVTDRVTTLGDELGALSRLKREPLGPMKIRGAGMVRLTRLLPSE